MIELVFTACLLASPSDCRPERIQWDGNEITCALYAQHALAEWQNTHPSRFVSGRHRCQHPEVET